MKAERSISVRDPLYGRFELPGFLASWISTPEFSRLGGVRLLNYESIELAALSEARRRSHTLGVMHLSTRLLLLGFGADELKAFIVAVLLHDIATPAFGHSLEYEFIVRFGLNHEEAAQKLVGADHHIYGQEHQMPNGRSVQLYKLMNEFKHADKVNEILRGEHPLSVLLFGDLDLDNLDNVYRMAWYLGSKADFKNVERLTSSLDVGRDGQKLLPYSNKPMVVEWARLRKESYSALFDSPMHRQKQAIFSRIIFEAMEEIDGELPLLEEEDWYMTDEAVLQVLRKAPSMKAHFKTHDKEELLPGIHVEFELEGPRSRAELTKLERSISARFDEVRDLKSSPRGDGVVFRHTYVSLIPIGYASERRVSFVDPDSGVEWSVGSPKPVFRAHVIVDIVDRTRIGRSKLSEMMTALLEECFNAVGWEYSAFQHIAQT